MNLSLNRPLCVFDLETTGTQISKDRIVEICILKVNPDGSKVTKSWLVNPEMPIPKVVSEIHGIYDDDVKNAPTLKEIAPQISEMIAGADIAGFNSNRFDVPLLAEELLRVGVEFDVEKHHLIDVQTIFHKKEPRNLTAAYQFYCNKNLENAHSAEADVMATFEVLDAQIGKYTDLPKAMSELSSYTQYHQNADLAGFIGYDENGVEIFSFGKYKGQSVAAVFQKDMGYFGWLQNADFPLYTKKIWTKIKLREKF